MCWVMPPGFPGRHVGFADDVQQRRLAVIDVAHDRHHRRPRLHVLRLVLDVQLDFATGVWAPAPRSRFSTSNRKSILGANPLRHVLVDGLVDVGEHAHLHQVGDDLEGLAFQLLGQIAHDDRRLERDQLAGGRWKEFLRRLARGPRGRGRFGSRPGARPLSRQRPRASRGRSAGRSAAVAAPGSRKEHPVRGPMYGQ